MKIAEKLLKADVVSAGEYELNLRKMYFKDKSIEEAYLTESFLKSLMLVRMTMVAGCLSILSFAYVDRILMDDKTFYISLLIRLMTIGGVIGIFAFTYTKTLTKYAQTVFCCGVIGSIAGVLTMLAISEAPTNSTYYAGLLAIILYPHLLKIKFSYGTTITICMIIGYNIVSGLINPIKPNILISNNFFLVTTAILCITIHYFHEYYQRLDFVNKILAEKSRAAAEELFLEAHSANRTKSQFLAVVSHELRTPLNAIIGFSEVIKEQMFGPVDNQQYLEYASDINESGQHLLQLITDIMEISRVEAGKATVDPESIDIAELTHSCLKMITPMAAEKNIRVSYAVPSDNLLVYADKRMSKQSLSNLLTNAVKFTPRDGAIEIFTGQDDDLNIYIQVQDNGHGIAPENIAKVVKPFEQIHDAYSRENEGLGLGLPLVKKFMNMHDGDLIIESTLGEGSTITLIYPKKRNLGFSSTELSNQLQQAS